MDKKPLQIVIDARILGSSTGRYVEGLLKGLQEIDKTNSYTVLLGEHNIKGFKPQSSSFHTMLAPFPQFSLNPIAEIKFANQLRKLKPDVMHFSMTQQPLSYFGRIVTTTHDLGMLKFLRPGRYKGIIFLMARKLYVFLMKWSHSKSKAIIVPSEFVKKDLLAWQKMPKDKITVTYEAAEINKSHQSTPIRGLKDNQFILYVGNAFPHKNIERLVDAFAVLQKQNPDLHLALAGKKEKYYEALEAYIQKKNVSGVHVLGWVSDDELAWAYENCQAYVFPSLNEGFGLPGLEAMAFGAAVVSSNATCLPEIYGDAAHYFDPEKSEDIARKIQEVLDNDKLKQKLIASGSQQVKKYSWIKMAQETLQIYERVGRGAE